MVSPLPPADSFCDSSNIRASLLSLAFAAHKTSTQIHRFQSSTIWDPSGKMTAREEHDKLEIYPTCSGFGCSALDSCYAELVVDLALMVMPRDCSSTPSKAAHVVALMLRRSKLW